MNIMCGDACSVWVEITNGESIITPDDLDDLEICVGSVRCRRTLKGCGVSWDAEKQMFKFRLSQEDTFAMRSDNQVIARVKYKNEPDFDVRGISLGSISVAQQCSRKVL